MKMFYFIQFLDTFALTSLMATLAKSQTVRTVSGHYQIVVLFFFVCFKSPFQVPEDFEFTARVRFCLSPCPAFTAAFGPS